MKDVQFNVSSQDEGTIYQIAHRAMPFMERYGFDVPVLTLLMDLTAVHANGCPLRLNDLLEAPDADFVHDVFGIISKIDRDTGRLTDCFLPRFAA